MEKWIEKITNEISLEFHHKYLFEEYNEIVTKNTVLQKMDNTVLIWMRDAFTEDAVIGIGRICDRGTRTDSLVRFLEALKNKPEYLTRERFKKLHQEPHPELVSFGDMGFDQIAGKGQQSFPIDFIIADIKKLTVDDPIKKILTYRNTYIAHSDKNKELAPTYYELFEAFKIIEDIIKKYNMLIKAANVRQLNPVIQGNWKEVFTIPWMAGQR